MSERPGINVTDQMQGLLGQATPEAAEAAEKALKVAQLVQLRERMKQLSELQELVHVLDDRGRQWSVAPWRDGVRMDHITYFNNRPESIVDTTAHLFTNEYARMLGEALIAAASVSKKNDNAPFASPDHWE